VSTPEIETFWKYISSSVEHLLGCLEGLSEEDINWRPLEHANSLYVLANHVMGNIAENMLEVLCGQPVHRQREAEFTAQGSSPEALDRQWMELKERVHNALSKFPPDDLEQSREHPRRGSMTGREVLIVVARHAAEHMGQAYLTRDLLLSLRGKVPPARRY
jgi:uncharacterized damage-inducible protein DinB